MILPRFHEGANLLLGFGPYPTPSAQLANEVAIAQRFIAEARRR